MKVYMDNGATTQMVPEAVKEMKPYFDKKFGNPSSLHYLGEEAHEDVDKVRETIAKAINAQPEEIIFTSGGTEADNLAIFGAVYANKSKGNHIITTKIEHNAVKNCFKHLEKEGFRVTYLDVDEEGFVQGLESALTKDTIFVSVIHANHEIGVIQDISKMGKLCRDKGIIFHTDACQSFTKTELDVKKQSLDLVALNGHKIHGPKGVGALYVRKGVKVNRINEGGPQEFNLRAGTENVPLLIGFAKSVEVAMKDYDKNLKYVSKLRDNLMKELLKISDTKLNGPKDMTKRTPNNLNITFDFIEGEAILMHLSLKGICVSTGSACSSQSLEPSAVLMSLGLRHEQAHGAIRFTLSKFNTEKEIGYVVEQVKGVVESLRKLTTFTKDYSIDKIKRK